MRPNNEPYYWLSTPADWLRLLTMRVRESERAAITRDLRRCSHQFPAIHGGIGDRTRSEATVGSAAAAPPLCAQPAQPGAGSSSPWCRRYSSWSFSPQSTSAACCTRTPRFPPRLGTARGRPRSAAPSTATARSSRRSSFVGQGFPVKMDPNSIVGNSDPNNPSGALQPTVPPPNVAYAYIWPAVATAAPADANCTSSNQRAVSPSVEARRSGDPVSLHAAAADSSPRSRRTSSSRRSPW